MRSLGGDSSSSPVQYSTWRWIAVGDVMRLPLLALYSGIAVGSWMNALQSFIVFCEQILDA